MVVHVFTDDDTKTLKEWRHQYLMKPKNDPPKDTKPPGVLNGTTPRVEGYLETELGAHSCYASPAATATLAVWKRDDDGRLTINAHRTVTIHSVSLRRNPVPRGAYVKAEWLNGVWSEYWTDCETDDPDECSSLESSSSDGSSSSSSSSTGSSGSDTGSSTTGSSATGSSTTGSSATGSSATGSSATSSSSDTGSDTGSSTGSDTGSSSATGSSTTSSSTATGSGTGSSGTGTGSGGTGGTGGTGSSSSGGGGLTDSDAETDMVGCCADGDAAHTEFLATGTMVVDPFSTGNPACEDNGTCSGGSSTLSLTRNTLGGGAIVPAGRGYWIGPAPYDAPWAAGKRMVLWCNPAAGGGGIADPARFDVFFVDASGTQTHTVSITSATCEEIAFDVFLDGTESDDCGACILFRGTVDLSGAGV